VGGVWLHSRYEPEREAMRLAESEIAAAKPSHVLLLGPCLDYLSPAVRTILPGARIAAVQYSSFFASAFIGRADAVWYPDSPSTLESFIDSALDEDAISGVAVIEWEPASRVFPEEALAARRAVKASLDRLASSTATVKASGRSWIANACASFLLLERLCAPEPSSAPILVAAAGPSLLQSLLGLSRIKGRFRTIAVSSALAACRYAEIEPDIVVATDGNFWSRLHLYPLASKRIPLAAPLTALPSASIYRGSSLMLLDQGSFAESELLPCLGPALAVPPHGTVSGTALQLASKLTQGSIVVAGLDLASFGDLDHARPHGFDAFLSSGVSRVNPFEARAWARSIESMPQAMPKWPWRTSRSLIAYASALALDSRALAGRLFRLGPSPTPLTGFADIDQMGFEALAGEGPIRLGPLRLAEFPLIARAERETILAGRLASWRELAARASDDLYSGVLPIKKLVGELLRCIDIVDYAAARRAILAGGAPGSAARDLASRCDSFLSALERRFAS
jgi:hypothetical protein